MKFLSPFQLLMCYNGTSNVVIHAMMIQFEVGVAERILLNLLSLIHRCRLDR